MSVDDKKCCSVWYVYECSKDWIFKICSSIDSNQAKELSDNAYTVFKTSALTVCTRGVDE